MFRWEIKLLAVRLRQRGRSQHGEHRQGRFCEAPSIQTILIGWAFACLCGIYPSSCCSDEPIELNGHTDAVYDVAFSPDGQLIASGSYDKTVTLWNPSNQKKLATLYGHKDQVFRVTFSPDGKSLASCSGDGTVIIWDVAKRKRKTVLAGHGDPIVDATYSQDGNYIATAGSHVQLWKQTQQVWSTPHSNLFFAVEFSPDQRTLACGTTNLIRFYDVTAAEHRGDINAGNGMVYQLGYSPNARWLASACSDGTLALWDARSREKKTSVTADNSALFTCAFSSNGKRLVSGGRERVIRVWEVPSLQLVSEELGPSETILSVQFSRDGEWIAAGSYDGKIHLWSPDE